MITVNNVSKTFYNKTLPFKVLDKINFKIKKDEFISIVGPNACGKTTFLKLFAGLDRVSSGNIDIGGIKNTEDIRVGFIFQDFKNSLYPWRTVEQNIGLALDSRDLKKQERNEIIENLLEKLNLKKHKNKYPYQLSGGLAQLVSIARAIAFEPDIFLLDEPFSALDYQTTVRMQKNFLRIWRENKKPVIFISHSLEEAIFLSDKVIVFSEPPTRVIKIIKVNLPRPRRINCLTSAKFINLKKEVLEVFKGYLS